MKKRRELSFSGTAEQLLQFITDLKLYAKGDWDCKKVIGQWKRYLLFDYTGIKVPKSRLSIYIGENQERLETGLLKVGNIVPFDKEELTIEEYNDVLLRFYEDVLVPYSQGNPIIQIAEPTSGGFDPSKHLSQEAIEKLHLFCDNADKNVGIVRPEDQKRWYDFICQTVDDDRVLDGGAFIEFLQDETYWSERSGNEVGDSASSPWSESMARKLVNDYQTLTNILVFYKDRKETSAPVNYAQYY